MPANLMAAGRGFLIGGGEMGARVRAHDWGATPLGPIERWPQSLRTAISMMLNSKFPIYMTWGPDLISFCNDAYRPILGAKPEALGRPFAEVWAEAWDTIGPIAAKAMVGDASYFENMPLTLERHGAPENTWWTFSYSPIRDESGGVGGVLCTVYETTSEVRSRAVLQSEKDRLQALFQQAPGIMVMFSGPEHVYELANRAHLDHVGHRDLIGKTVRAALPELEGQGVFELLDEVYATGKSYVGHNMPVSLQRRVGAPRETRYVDFVYQPIRDDLGQVTGIFVQGHDVTEYVQSQFALRESEARLAAIFAQASVGLSELSPEGRFLRVNDELCRLLGRTREELLGFRILDVTVAADVPPSLIAIGQVLEMGGPIALDKRYMRSDGALIWANSSLTRLDPALGQPGSLLAATLDLTARREAEAALRESEARLRLALDAGRMAVWESDTRTNTLITSPELNFLLGFPPEAVPTIDEIRSRYAPGARDGLQAAAIAALERGDRYAEGELEVIWPDGSHHWLLVRAEMEVTLGTGGSPQIKATGIAFDITGRKRWEEHQRLLINELNHRVKNTLATVQAMAAQSLRQVSEDSRPKLQSFEDRLFALARAHDVLTRESWEGAELREIINEVVEPYARGSSGRFEIKGPRLRLNPRRALAIAMAIHELATNAAKYGALSVPAGYVTLMWGVVSEGQPRLILQWQERDGPEVASPTRRGFGTRLIERSLAQDLGGHVRLTYAPPGVTCVVDIPLSDAGEEPSMDRL